MSAQRYTDSSGREWKGTATDLVVMEREGTWPIALPRETVEAITGPLTPVTDPDPLAEAIWAAANVGWGTGNDRIVKIGLQALVEFIREYGEPYPDSQTVTYQGQGFTFRLGGTYLDRDGDSWVVERLDGELKLVYDGRSPINSLEYNAVEYWPWTEAA